MRYKVFVSFLGVVCSFVLSFLHGALGVEPKYPRQDSMLNPETSNPQTLSFVRLHRNVQRIQGPVYLNLQPKMGLKDRGIHIYMYRHPDRCMHNVCNIYMYIYIHIYIYGIPPSRRWGSIYSYLFLCVCTHIVYIYICVCVCVCP